MKDESSCRKLMEHFGLSKFQVQAIANGLNTAKDSDDLFQVVRLGLIRCLFKMTWCGTAWPWATPSDRGES
jgi:hypothetical protein